MSEQQSGDWDPGGSSTKPDLMRSSAERGLRELRGRCPGYTRSNKYKQKALRVKFNHSVIDGRGEREGPQRRWRGRN